MWSRPGGASGGGAALGGAGSGESHRRVDVADLDGDAVAAAAAVVILYRHTHVVGAVIGEGAVKAACSRGRVEGRAREHAARATALAVSVGQALAWILGLVGLLQGNFLWMLVAIFVYSGAAQEGRMIQVKNALGSNLTSRSTGAGHRR